jgi:hypothetical protein
VKALDYSVIRSRRRSLELRLYPDRRIEVRVPLRASNSDISAFVASKAAWLQRRLDSMAENSGTSLVPPALQYCDGEEHLFLGRRYPLSLSQGARSHTALHQDQLCLLTPQPDNPARVAAQLARWYRQQGEVIFTQMIEQHFPFFAARGYQQPKLRMRVMKTRWGSLSSRGYINLNLELIKAPLQAIEYVVIHELCHLEHMNHGPDFHALMSERLPDWRERKRQLNRLVLR